MNKATIENRNNSYSQLDLNKSQKIVYEAIYKLGKATNKQIAEYLKFPINKITGRVKELREKNAIKIEGSVFDESTKRKVTVFAPMRKFEQLELFPKKEINTEAVIVDGTLQVSRTRQYCVCEDPLIGGVAPEYCRRCNFDIK